MRSRTMREGSVGLLVLLGLLLFGGLTFWLRGFRFGSDSYTLRIVFENSNGMTIGGAVRYRGVKVGSITSIRPGTNGIEISVSIAPADLAIPREVTIQANQSGLISDTIIEIAPLAPLDNPESLANPLSANCNAEIILCDGDLLEGESGISLDDALRSSVELSERFSDPLFFDNLNELTENASLAAANVADLSKELTAFSAAAREQIQPLSGELRRVGSSADVTLRAYAATATRVNQLSDNLNILVTENRTNLRRTLDNISRTSSELGILANNLNSTLATSDTQAIAANLEALSGNAAQASADLRDITATFNNPLTFLALQQLLDSARATFDNAQKITSDLDELTGDPEFRNNLLELVNGLSDLVSSTQQLEQQVQTAQSVEPAYAEVQAVAENLDEAQPERQPAAQRETAAPAVDANRDRPTPATPSPAQSPSPAPPRPQSLVRQLRVSPDRPPAPSQDSQP